MRAAKMRLTFSKIANDANISCYKFDKVLWLIGSGRFYKNPNFYDEYQKPVRVIRAEGLIPTVSRHRSASGLFIVSWMVFKKMC